MIIRLLTPYRLSLPFNTAVKGSLPEREDGGSKGAEGDKSKYQGHRTPVNSQRYEIYVKSQYVVRCLLVKVI